MDKQAVRDNLNNVEKEIKDIQNDIRSKKKANKGEIIKTNAEINELKDKIINKKASLLKIGFVGGASLLGAIISLIVGGFASAVSLGFFVGFGVLTVSSAVAGYFAYKNKLKLEKKILSDENKVAILSCESFENQKLNYLLKQKENYIATLEAFAQKGDKFKNKGSGDKSKTILSAIKRNFDSAKFVDGNEYDATNEALLNYQKNLAAKTKKQTEEDLNK